MKDADLEDTLMRLTILGLIVDPSDIQAFENSHVNPPAGGSASTASKMSGIPPPRVSSLHIQVRDPRSNQTISYARSRVVGISAEQPGDPVTSPSIAPPTSSNVETDMEATSTFIPAHAFSQFPRDYIIDAGQENYITQHWFKKFWDRSWDLFLLPVPDEEDKASGILLIPEPQTQAMLTEINTAISERLSLGGMIQDGLALRFDLVRGPKPIYLGKSNSYEEKETIKANISSFKDYARWEKYTENLTDAARAAFEVHLKNTILPAEKNGASESSEFKKIRRAEKRAEVRMERQLQLTRTLELLQTWLGLRRRCVTALNQEQDLLQPPINVLMAAPYPFEDDILFIGIDCEWMERSSENLTEVGLSILDTRDLANLPPSDYGANWKKRIKSHHLRVSEYEYHVNNEFCHGCPDKFEWGESAIIDKDDMGKAIDACLGRGRSMIFVGLDMKRDMELIGLTGSTVFGRLKYADQAGAYCRLDVADLFQVLRGRPERLGMVKLLHEMNEDHTEHLHNAGNDARYTMHLLIRIALESAGEKSESME
ncbi:hypothetical protein N7478_009859 [Penicillium angulare]|uniref:uncharacterized protein n=1 Tax=Penicillium angulare TaxID=116970 RepID=UPI002541AA2D|nr:uncharacterized protein N7478_009859 [Penicillium angulare]KAJ5267051.1 hypothetical protein N7478_009859 [Penicillium angulare]